MSIAAIEQCTLECLLTSIYNARSIPFGKGEFACGGKAFALFSLRWTIAVMSRFFSFEAHASTTDESMDMRGGWQTALAAVSG